MENFQEAIDKLRDEFIRHQSTEASTRFQPSLEASTALSMITRDLETKRQLESLTGAEKKVLLDIGALWQDIARFNNQVPIQKSRPSPPEQTYNLTDHQFVEPSPQSTPETPIITHEQAEEIVARLNKQFAEKGYNHRNAVEPYSPTLEAGRNLQDYISHLQSQKPKLPFVGEESHIDLDVLRSRTKN